MKQTMEFEFLEHTADLRFKAYGENLDECFQNTAKAMYTAITDPESIEEKQTREITLEAETLETLLHDFLAELLFLSETEGLLFKEFQVSVDSKEGYRLKSMVRGENYNPGKHEIKTEIKAVTYHELQVEEIENRWTAQVLCDI
jgi:SHS2 domain-containing protein